MHSVQIGKKIKLLVINKMLAITEIIIASAIFLGIVYWEVKFLYTKTTVAKWVSLKIGKFKT